MSKADETRALAEKIRQGGAPKYHESNAAAGKLFCRERIAAFARAGVTQPVVVPFAPPGADRASLLRTLRAFP